MGNNRTLGRRCSYPGCKVSITDTCRTGLCFTHVRTVAAEKRRGRPMKEWKGLGIMLKRPNAVEEVRALPKVTELSDEYLVACVKEAKERAARIVAEAEAQAAAIRAEAGARTKVLSSSFSDDPPPEAQLRIEL